MNRLIISIALFFFANFVYSQDDVKGQIVKGFRQINSIDPSVSDFSDVENIGKAIGNSRIVFLGEQDHGDAPTFLAKTRLVKYLHEKMDFDVLVFESDFWGLNRVWDNRLNDSILIKHIMSNTYGIWSMCVQAQDLYAYLNNTFKTNDPLIVSGTDCRHALSYTKKNYCKELVAFTNSQRVFTDDTTSLNKFLRLTDEIIKKEYDIKISNKEFNFYTQYIDKVTLSISDPFWKQEFINLKGGALTSYSNCYKTIRDEYMAKNLLWLYNKKFKGKKMIVWAHSAHNAKNIKMIPHRDSTTMGNEVYKLLKDSIYNVGFTSLTGKAGRIVFERKYKVDKAMKNSFESWVSTKNYDYGFVDFKSINNTTDFYMKGLGHSSEKTDWTKVFDGIFYIKDMYPCDKTK